MIDAQAMDLQARFRRMAASYCANRGALPGSIDRDDLVQEALLEALKCEGKFVYDGRAKFSSYINKPVLGRWADVVARSHYGPPPSTRSWRRARGMAVDYGEVSIECLASDGTEFLAGIATESGEVAEVSYFTLTQDEARECLENLDEQIKASDSGGISWAKTRKKWHVAATVCGRSQFIGQFKALEDAMKAKQDFLISFRDAVLDAIQ